MKTALIIDDEASLRLMVRAVLEAAGWSVTEADSGYKAVSILEANPTVAGVALLDMRMPGMDGHETLARLHEINPALPVIMLTAYGTVGSAVDAMKRGAFDYITKPADNDELVTVLEKAWQYAQLVNENIQLKQQLDDNSALSSLVGATPAMRALHEFIMQVAPSEATVLIMGESGTGKELVAQALHNASNRADKPLIKINCAALPGQLLESELFGYEKGAFTGAVKDKPGRFMLARGGSIFLDEIGELPLDLQAKLLRVLQEREVEPLGALKPVQVDVRVICATNRNLRAEVAAGNFREDLFFRLNVLEAILPPLRERIEDLPLLVQRLLEKLSQKNKKNIRGVSTDFLAALGHYNWPGNVRELENILERSLILSRADIITPDVLPAQLFATQIYSTLATSPAFGAAAPVPENSNNMVPLAGSSAHATAMHSTFNNTSGNMPQSNAGARFKSTLEEAEYQALLAALQEHGGHRERTAEALGLSRRTLQYKLKKFGLIRDNG